VTLLQRNPAVPARGTDPLAVSRSLPATDPAAVDDLARRELDMLQAHLMAARAGVLPGETEAGVCGHHT